MRIAILGANGAIGSRLVAEAHDRGHEVTAVVRDRTRAANLPPGVEVGVADATCVADVAAAVAGHDAVIVAVGGAGSGKPNVVVDVARTLIEALPRAGVTRLAIVGGAGSLEDRDGNLLGDASDFPEAWKPASLAQREALAVYQSEADALEWSYLSPADVIEPGDRTGSFVLGKDRAVFDAEGVSRISIEDYACALIDELEKAQHVRQRFTVGYA
jgi:hypothetical protein